MIYYEDAMADQEKYKKSGVDLDAAESVIEQMKDRFAETSRDGVIDLPNGFAGLFRLREYKNPVLTGCTDGVGTKLKIAFDAGKHDTIGIDLVAMCVNDAICVGAEPLFFLDYLATSGFKAEIAEEILTGIVEGCKQAHCALLGGETAQLPGFYKPGEYDLGGFCVGVVEEDELIKGDKIVEGDVLLGLASSGLHSNGFSLVRKILFDDNKIAQTDILPGFDRPLWEILLEPTQIYVRQVLAALERFGVENIHGIANMTGGGITGNLPRIFPESVSAEVSLVNAPRAEIFKVLHKLGELSELEMRSIFNCGVGMILVVEKSTADDIQTFIKAAGVLPFEMGKIIQKQDKSIIYKDL